VKAYLRTFPAIFLQPVRLFEGYQRENLRPDLIAGLTVAVILLPQAIAFALIAELPPQMGLFTAIVGAAVGALWGSSNQSHTGPTNAISLLVLSVLLTTASPGTNEFILAAGLLAVMVGMLQLAMGLARLGVLVNFVSHSVIVGFASGAGILIAAGQLRHLLGLSFESHNVLQTLSGVAVQVGNTNIPTAALGVGTMIAILVLNRLAPRLPAALISLIAASLAVFALGLDERGVVVIGQLPASLPPLAELPWFDLPLIARLSTGALAVGAIGLVETSAISRAIATHTGQRLDSNQEFVGQGLANIACGLFSGYPAAGSFSRSAVNANAGARSPMAALLSGAFVLIGMLTLSPLAAFLPRAGLAGVLILTAYRMINRAEIRRIWSGAPGDAVIMVVTLLGTLFLELEFAVLLGILLSFGIYIMRTSAPRVVTVVPDENFKHLVHRPDSPQCSQLGILDLMGDLYFGAVSHVENSIYDHQDAHPDQRYLLIRMHHVQQMDFSGVHMLESVLRSYRDRGGDIFLMQVRAPVYTFLCSTGFDQYLGTDHFLSHDEAVTSLFYKVLDPAVCIYECGVRVFKECQNLPKPDYTFEIPLLTGKSLEGLARIHPLDLWQTMKESNSVYVVDLREPREFRRGHIDGARHAPLARVLQRDIEIPREHPVVLVCQTGRRSARAAAVLLEWGHENLQVLSGGMAAWETAGLLEAVDLFHSQEGLE
jgi:SulP family sulfate permease